MHEDAPHTPRAAVSLNFLRPGAAEPARLDRGDLVALAIVATAIMLFVAIGGLVVAAAVRSIAGTGAAPDLLLVAALLLNVALILFGWRRHSDLTSEVAERRRAEAQARLLAETDPLTGCLNRRSIGPAADRLIAQTAARGEAVAVIMLDLDKFKQVNDLNSHAAGDALLAEAARRICDLLPEHALLARIGGDEFACVVPYAPGSPEQLDRLAAGLIAAISRPVKFRGLEIGTTVSAGIAAPQPGTAADALALLHNADIAMYAAKKHGRNRSCWFEPAMESELKLRSELEAALRRGVANAEFVPVFQKQIDLDSGEITGFEMLARWNSPSLGQIGPEVFVPIAEDTGLIGQLSEQLLRQALGAARNWHPRLTLSVNISPFQLRDPWFAQKLLRLLVETSFPANRLEIEVTESCLHENLGLVRTAITSLQNQGVQVSLDDFGTGYSSLSQLRSLPFDRIKIDRSFVATVNDSDDSATIVQSIVALGTGLGLPITAEGIETPEVLRTMRQLGQFKGQGFLYGLPTTAEATASELARLGLLCPAPDREDAPLARAGHLRSA